MKTCAKNDPPHFAWEKHKTKRKKRVIVSELFADYSSNAALHGVAYIGAKDKTLPEKVWWIVTFTMSVCLCAYLIGNTWLKWSENPIIISFTRQPVDIWEIPFPAVTFCPVNKVMQTRYKEFWDISLICRLDSYLQYVHNFNCTFNYTDEEATQNIINAAPQLENVVESTVWSKVADETLLSAILTEEGHCFAFNIVSQEDMFTDEIMKGTIIVRNRVLWNQISLPLHSYRNPDIPRITHKIKNTGWSLEKGYKSSSNIKNDYPRRAITSGAAAGLSLNLKSHLSSRDFVCGLPTDGFKLMLHSPMELPKTQLEYYFIPPDRKTIIILKPEMIVTSKALRSMSIKIRKCYFQGEKTLRFFRTYTINNCVLECFTNITLHYCGCVAISMPRDRNTRPCGFLKIKCIQEATLKFLSYKMNEAGIKVSEVEQAKPGYKIYSNCDCLPACFNLKFTAEISHAKLNMSKTLMASGVLDNITSTDSDRENKAMEATANIEIFFKESEFLSLQRNELYGKTDFLANCGGLLGLFLGFSILSLIEIIYFLTLRLWCKMMNR